MMVRPGSQRRVELSEPLDDPLLALRHDPHAFPDGDRHEDQYRDDDDFETHGLPLRFSDLQDIALDVKHLDPLADLDLLVGDRLPDLVAEYRLLKPDLALVEGPDIPDDQPDLADQRCPWTCRRGSCASRA